MPRVAAPGPKPWEVEGISRSKYFRNKREKTAEAPKRPGRPKKLRAVGAPKRRGRPPGAKNKLKLTPFAAGLKNIIGNGSRRGLQVVIDPVDRAMVREFIGGYSDRHIGIGGKWSITDPMLRSVCRVLAAHGYDA